MYGFVRTLMYSFVKTLMYSFVRTVMYSFVRTLMYSVVRILMYSVIRTVIYSFVHFQSHARGPHRHGTTLRGRGLPCRARGLPQCVILAVHPLASSVWYMLAFQGQKCTFLCDIGWAHMVLVGSIMPGPAHSFHRILGFLNGTTMSLWVYLSGHALFLIVYRV